MDKLRNFVWDKLSDFFKLCEQSVCSECLMKSTVYFQFIQAVALYEIFYLSLIQGQTENCVKKEIKSLNQISEQLCKINELTKEVNNNHLSPEAVFRFQKAIQELNNNLDDKVMMEFHDNSCQLEIYQLLVMEFGITYNAMCCLLMIFEAMQVCNYEMRGLKHLSLKIEKNYIAYIIKTLHYLKD